MLYRIIASNTCGSVTTPTSLTDGGIGAESPVQLRHKPYHASSGCERRRATTARRRRSVSQREREPTIWCRGGEPRNDALHRHVERYVRPLRRSVEGREPRLPEIFFSLYSIIYPRSLCLYSAHRGLA